MPDCTHIYMLNMMIQQKDEVLDYYPPSSLSLAGSGKFSLTSGKLDF